MWVGCLVRVGDVRADVTTVTGVSRDVFIQDVLYPSRLFSKHIITQMFLCCGGFATRFGYHEETVWISAFTWKHDDDYNMQGF